MNFLSKLILLRKNELVEQINIYKGRMNYRYESILINRNELATGININRNE